jgi:methyl-accepting chemotaxis protein
VNAIASSIAAAVEQQGAATAEIARNVTETAEAANEMTRRTGEVSTEAELTRASAAAEVRDGISALNNQSVGESEALGDPGGAHLGHRSRSPTRRPLSSQPDVSRGG